jgi:hypothetical protein
MSQIDDPSFDEAPALETSGQSRSDAPLISQNGRPVKVLAFGAVLILAGAAGAVAAAGTAIRGRTGADTQMGGSGYAQGALLVTAEAPPEATRPVEPTPNAAQPDTSRQGKTAVERLALLSDPNVVEPAYVALRLESESQAHDGPRLALSDLNESYTYSFGVIPREGRVEHSFKAANVGSADLAISRIYAACGCTATRVEGASVNSAGFILPDPLVLAPGQSTTLTIEYDPRTSGTFEPQAKYVQIFTNDPTKALFDAEDPNSHETRFRIVVDPD